MAANSWLHSQTQQSPYRYDKDRGYVCTLSALVLKSTTAHLFHAGDARIYRLHGDALEQLTTDHRVWVSQRARAISAARSASSPHLEIDYLATAHRARATCSCSPPTACTSSSATLADRRSCASTRPISTRPRARSSTRGLRPRQRATISPRRSCASSDCPTRDAQEASAAASRAAVAAAAGAAHELDGYQIVRELHASARSHLYLATDTRQPARRWSSRRRRPSCATTPRTWSAS